MLLDEYDTVLNGAGTYKQIKHIMLAAGHVIFAWTDQAGSQLDILMAYGTPQFGNLQGGMSADTDLFVAVSRRGFFGFELNGAEKSAAYVGEKLNLDGANETTRALADLINGVCRELEAYRGHSKIKVNEEG